MVSIEEEQHAFQENDHDEMTDDEHSNDDDDLEEQVADNTEVLHTLIDLLVEKGVITYDEMNKKIESLDADDSEEGDDDESDEDATQ